MRVLALDIETYSSVDLKKCGVHAYTEAPDFEILLFAYAWDDEPVQVVDLAQGEPLPADVAAALVDARVLKTAFNAAFERATIRAHFGIELPPEQWRCTAVHARMLGLPGDLDGVAKALRLSVQKDTAGKSLIRYFSVPCKPTKANGGRTRNLPEHAPERWERFKAYCAQDVEVERRIREKLARFEWPEMERRLWALDQEINDRGVMVDMQVVRQAIHISETLQKRLEAEAVELTGLDNPNSVAQLKAWLNEAEGIEVESLNKQTVPELLNRAENDAVRRVLEIRQELAKASVKKYQAIKRSVGRDCRVRELLQFHGAGRTGRWAGRLVQVQNLPKNSMPDLDHARYFVRQGRLEDLEMLYDNVQDVLSQLIRTAFIPRPCCRFIVADFSAIEARVVAWLAGEQWRLDVFATHGKIYEASASQMFKVPIEQITKGSPLRQRGKIAELALGYGGGPVALRAMDTKRELPDDELPGLVQAWRAANPNIVQFWWDMEAAARLAVNERRTVPVHHGIEFSYEAGILFMRLPSGRRLAYVRPRLEPDPKTGRLGITYDGAEQGRWGRVRTYGGKLVENCLAGDTEVLTQRGWIPIRDVQPTDVLWDGIEWVAHDGVVEKGIQQTISLDGVRMTPDHLVLTEEGWLNASSCAGHRRAAATLPDSTALRRIGRQKVALGCEVRLRQGVHHVCFGIPQRQTEILRMQTESSTFRASAHSWDVEASGIRGVALDDRSMPPAIAPRMGELRRPGDPGVRSLDAEFREFLERHGPFLSTGADTRPDRREWRLRPGKLQMDSHEGTEPKPPQESNNQHALGSNDGSGSGREVGCGGDHATVSTKPRMAGELFICEAGRTEPVFDVINAGPRNRFTVKGRTGPFIVHNCTQAVARDCLAEAMLRLDQAGYQIVMHVHDEVVLEVPHGYGSADEVAAIMGKPISWAPGLPLRADAYECDYYRKD